MLQHGGKRTRPGLRPTRATLWVMPITSEWRATLRLAGGPLECTIRQSGRARNLRLTVDPRHTAVVTVPLRATRSRAGAERLALEFVAEREAWLRRHLADQAHQVGRVAALGPLADGGSIPFRGDLHRLLVIRPSATTPARSTVSRVGGDDGAEIVVRLGRAERRPLADILEAWLRVRARSVIEREIERHAPALGVSPSALTVRDARTRWGSCSRRGRLSFSWRLVLAPPEALETVVVHELAHLRVFGHGPGFWAVVAQRRPDHRRWRRWLRDHRLELHAALG